MEQDRKQVIIKEEEIFDLIRKLLNHKKWIFCATVLFFVLGVIVAFTSIKRYTVSVVVAPESSSTSIGGTIGSLASMAGFDIGGIDGGQDAIYPMLYPEIMESLPFLTDLYQVPVQSLDGRIDTTYWGYRKCYHRRTISEKVKDAPKKMAKKIAGLFVKKQPFLGNPDVLDPYYLSEGQLSMVEGLRKDMHINVDKKTDVITISFTSQEPKVSAIMADSITSRLQEVISAYRTKKAKNDYDYINKQYLRSKSDYETAQLAYAIHQDRNMGIKLERAMIESNRLEADKDLKFELYNQWSQQLQLAAAKVQESTPAFTVLKPAAIPALPSSRRKVATILIWTVMGFILSVIGVAIKDPVLKACRKIRYC